MILRTVFLLLLAALTLPAVPQSHETVNVTAIEVMAEVHDKSGLAPEGLTAADFTILEDGVEQKVIGVDYLARRQSAPVAAVVETAAPQQQPAPPPPAWHFLFYFESELSSSPGRKLVAEALRREVDRYVGLGTVDVVFASPTPVALVQGSRDPKAISDALQKVTEQRGINQLQVNRRRFREWMVSRPNPPDFNDIRPFIDDDIRLITLFRKNLQFWLSNYRRHSPRMAIVVTDGFDLDPINFYAMEAQAAPRDPTLASQLRALASGTELGTGTSQLAKELAGGSWIISSVPGQMDMGMTVDDASTWGIGRVRGQVAPVRIGSKALVNLPMAPLVILAETTGGTVIGNHSKIGEAMDHLGRYVKITYQVGRPPDGKIRKVEVRSRRSDLQVRAQQWVSATTPEESAEARAVSLLSGGEFAGELPVEATLTVAEQAPALIDVTANLDALSLLIEENSRRHIRVTVAMLQAPKVHLVSRTVSNVDLSAGVFRYRLGLKVPESVSAMVVTVEDLASGAWGSARVNVKQ